MTAQLKLPPLALYVHLPWCVRKCPYCDFNSHTAPQRIPEAAYVDALLADLERDLPRVWGRPLVSIFIGGGTPSLFSAAAIDRLLCGVSARLPLRPAAEVTLEANPGTLERAPLGGYRQAGVNRLSLGVQSFDDQLLQEIGRIHSGKEAAEAVRAARSAGFQEMNIDLMYGLPGQTLEQAVVDVRRAADLGPTHISHYQLTIEPNTYFYAHRPTLPDQDRVADIQDACQAVLDEAGYAQYEVSAYAKEGHRCLHNLNYWRFGDYLGIGAGAHAKITEPAAGRILRLSRQRHPARFMGGSAAPDVRQVTAEELRFEFALNALRLPEGFPLAEYEGRTGLNWSAREAPWSEALSRGWIEQRDGWVRPTAQGLRFLNDVLALFLPETPKDSDISVRVEPCRGSTSGL